MPASRYQLRPMWVRNAGGMRCVRSLSPLDRLRSRIVGTTKRTTEHSPGQTTASWSGAEASSERQRDDGRVVVVAWQLRLVVLDAPHLDAGLNPPVAPREERAGVDPPEIEVRPLSAGGL